MPKWQEGKMDEVIVAGILCFLFVLAVAVIVFILHRRDRRRPLDPGDFNEEPAGINPQEARAGRMERLQMWIQQRVNAVGACLNWPRRHKFWTGLIIFYLIFLVISILYEYGIIR